LQQNPDITLYFAPYQALKICRSYSIRRKIGGLIKRPLIGLLLGIC
jgi:hypothetical protein